MLLLLLLQCGKALQGGSCPDFPQLPLRSSILLRASCVLHQDVARMLWQSPDPLHHNQKHPSESQRILIPSTGYPPGTLTRLGSHADGSTKAHIS